jgi:hypothetical protein
MSAEKAGHGMDERRSPPAGHPEQDDAGPDSPAPSTHLSEEESSQEQSEMDSGKASVETGSCLRIRTWQRKGVW